MPVGAAGGDRGRPGVSKVFLTFPLFATCPAPAHHIRHRAAGSAAVFRRAVGSLPPRRASTSGGKRPALRAAIAEDLGISQIVLAGLTDAQGKRSDGVAAYPASEPRPSLGDNDRVTGLRDPLAYLGELRLRFVEPQGIHREPTYKTDSRFVGLT